MSPPKVFISATSADLGSMRQVVKDALLTIGCHPVEQTHFTSDWRDVDQMLRERISDCQALIHIVGLRYGAEPKPATLPTSTFRHSYTQMEYHIGRDLQRKRGDKRFRVYTFVCPEDFHYDGSQDADSDEQQTLQHHHRETILDGSALYETPVDQTSLEKRVLALRENILQLRAAQSRRAQLILAGVVFIMLALAGIGYGVFRSYQDLPVETAEQVAKQLDTEAVATRLRKEIETRFQRDAEAAHAAGQNWEAIRKLERRRDAALGRVDEIIRTIKEGLAGNPSPIFTEATRVLEHEGVDAAIEYLQSHKTTQLARAERAAAQVAAAQEMLHRELRPLLLQAQLHETRLEWDQALALWHTVADLAPQWFEPRNRLGVLLVTLARYAEAEPHKRAAVQLASTPDEEAAALNNLALLLKATNRLKEAEPLMRRALAIGEASLGGEDPNVAIRLNNLAQLLQATNRLEEAEPLMRRALAIDEASFGSDHPEVAPDLNNLASLLQDTNRLKEAEPLMRRALAIGEASLGGDHPRVAIRLNNLAGLLKDTNRLKEAEPLMRRALAINEASFGGDHPTVASGLSSLAELLRDTSRLKEAEPLMRRALAIDEASLGGEHPNVAIRLNNLAGLLKDTNRLKEAEPLMRRALAIDEASYGSEHPRVAIHLNNLASLLQNTNRLKEAEPLMRRALAIGEASFGRDHPRVAAGLNNLAELLRDTNRLKEAEPLYRRALAINEASFVSDHPRVAAGLNNLALLLYTTNRLKEAEPLSRQVVKILLLFRTRIGHEHPEFKLVVQNYKKILAAMGRDKGEQEAAVEQLVESAKAVVLSQKIKQP